MYKIPPIKQGDKILYPFNPSTAVNFVLGCHYEYRKDAGTLKIMANGHEVMFEIESDRYVLDGVEKDLGYSPVLFDGLVMLDFEKLGKDLGYKTSTKDGNVYIYTDTYDALWKIFNERKTGVWEFNNLYDNEGFTSSHMSLVTRDGAMKMTTITQTNDPISKFAENGFPEDFYTKQFTGLEVKCRYKYSAGGGKSNIAFYYITDVDDKYDENKSLRLYFKDTDSKGEWEILTYDLTNESNWRGADRLTGLRFDPFNGQGEIEIDYIRFIEDPDFVYIPPEERPIEIINGDAEGDMMPFYSGNANITKVADPDNKDNNVWYVKGHEGNQWVYIRQMARFKPYTAYKVEYDIRVGSSTRPDGKGPDNTTFNTNFRYADKGAFNDFDHVVSQTSNTSLALSDGWKHVTATFSTGKIDDHKNSEFTIYLNPQDNHGFNYYVDNIVVTEIEDFEVKQPLSDSFVWANAKGKMLYEFDGSEQGYYVSGAKTKKVENGNLYLEVEAPMYDIQFGSNEFSFTASDYSAVTIRFKTEEVEEANAAFQVFFATDRDPELSENKSGKYAHASLKADKEGYMTAVIEFADNPAWEGRITALRFDPANSAGKYWIDKIMLVE